MELMSSKPEVIEEWYKICINSEKWKKWVSDESEAKDVSKIISITGHYTFSDPNFKKLKESLKIDNLDKQIILNHKKNILNIMSNIKNGLKK